MNVRNYWTFIFLLMIGAGCTGNAEKSDSKPEVKAVDLPTIKDKQLNISVLVDLSNRIDTKLHPEQASRDIAIVQNLAQVFKNNVDAFGAFKADSKLRIYFHPEPQDPQMATIAKELTANCEAGTRPENARHNKQIYMTVDSNFKNGLQQIYTLANNKSVYPGSNIWRFMKDEAQNKCIEDTNTFRNILVILTDGYLYYKNEMSQNKNRYTYIERNFPHFNKFRNTTLLNTEFDKDDYGLQPIGKKLNGLEVLIMGIAPDETYPQDYDIIQKYWSKWFDEMGIQHAVLVKSQQPVYSVKSINDFLLNRPQ